MTGLANNQPDVFKQLLRPFAESESSTVKAYELGPGAGDAIRRIIPKWGRAFHYLETGRIAPSKALIVGNFFTGVDFQGSYVPDAWFDLPRREMKRGNTDLSDYVGFLNWASEDASFSFFLILFRRAFAAWAIVDEKRQLEHLLQIPLQFVLS